jgi:hypothetical protein
VPAAPTLPTTITAGVTTGHVTDSQTVHTVVNSIYKASIGTTRTGSFTAAQSDSGDVIPVNAGTAVAVTVPSLQAGTSIELVRLGAGAVTLTASGVTLVVPTGATATPRVVGSTISLLWLTTTSVLVGGDLT